jgi:formamidopyrimidine-DNA glycosylase
LIGLDGDLTLVVHLRMTGDLVIVPRHVPPAPHTRVVFALDGDELRFIDQRRFGHMDLMRTGALRRFEPLRRLGVEPLARSFTLRQFRALLNRRRGAVKSLLLRQEVVAGIGNIYADEILFQARLYPARRVESLRPAEVRRLYQAVRRVRRRATAGLARYRRPIGDLLPGRERGGVCVRCGGPITMLRIGGRATYYCPSCQR